MQSLARASRTHILFTLAVVLAASSAASTTLASPPRGITVKFPAPEIVAAASSQAPILYLNRDGGTYTPGNHNDSREDVSIIPSMPSDIDRWDVDELAWTGVYECVRDQFARWDVAVTDIDPGDTPHFEAVIGGRSQDLGLPAGIGGVSPFRSDCGLIDNSIVYVFAEVYGDNYQSVCETIAQEIGHSIGLDHVFLCEDPMTYLGGCGAKSFQDVDAPCGESSSRPCSCGSATQNSVTVLNERLGEFGGPLIEVASPKNGASVPPKFNVVGRALDEDGVVSISLSIDDQQIASSMADNFVFETPALGTGAHILEIVAVDELGNIGRRRIQFSIDPSATDPTAGAEDLDNIDLACSAASRTPSSGALMLVFLGLIALRRRRSTN